MIEILGQRVKRTIGLLLILGLLKVFYGGLVLLQLEVDHSDEEEDVRPFEDLPTVVQEQVLERQVLSFC